MRPLPDPFQPPPPIPTRATSPKSPIIARRASMIKFPPMEVTWDEKISPPAGVQMPVTTPPKPSPQGPRRLQKRPPPKVVNFVEGEELPSVEPAPGPFTETVPVLVLEMDPLVPTPIVGLPVNEDSQELGRGKGTKRKKSLSKKLFGPRDDQHREGQPLPKAEAEPHVSMLEGSNGHEDLPPPLLEPILMKPHAVPPAGPSYPLPDSRPPEHTKAVVSPSPEPKPKGDVWKHHPYYFPEYTPIYPNGFPVPPPLPGLGPMTLAEIQAEKHAKILGRPVVVHYPFLPPFKEYGDKEKLGWKTGAYGMKD